MYQVNQDYDQASIMKFRVYGMCKYPDKGIGIVMEYMDCKSMAECEIEICLKKYQKKFSSE